MMAANPLRWFEIPVNDMDRAVKFYQKVFNLQLTLMPLGELSMALFPEVAGAAGAAGALVKATTYIPSHHGSMLYFGVEDIEGTLARVRENGGNVIRSKMSIGQYGFVGHFEDCEGNRVALHSNQ